MTGYVRVAGWGRGPDGSTVTWTVADGRKGRRWREVRADGAGVLHGLLLETDRDGRFSHLELARADGLWTFHPEPDGTLHGNHVGHDGSGVRHISGRPFGPDAILLIEGSPTSLAGVARGLASTMIVGEVRDLSGVVIRADGRLDEVDAVRIERLSATRWQVAEEAPFDIDEAGCPVLPDGAIRPLELG
jgi:hypothetical protein